MSFQEKRCALSGSIVSLQHVEKWYGNNHVVKDMNLEIAEGEFLTLLGPSGCGKTTTLRMIAGFEDASDGIILVQGERVEDKEPFQRDVNTVFQNYSLFPHMTVYDNVAYGPSIKKVPKAEIKRKVGEMLEMVQMSGYEKRKPDELSGGQKQRVAIARALINQPRVLLLDEPLGALDLKLRKQMQIELKRLQKKLEITFVYVTHDQEEAMTMSDRIAVMRDGIIEQIDTPSHIYQRPATRFVADFIGESNIFEGTVKEIDRGLCRIDTGNGMITAASGEQSGAASGRAVSARAASGPAASGIAGSGFFRGDWVCVSVRPEAMEVMAEPTDQFSLMATVTDSVYMGTLTKTLLRTDAGQEIKISRFETDGLMAEGSRVCLSWKPDKAVILRPDRPDKKEG